MSKTRTVLLAAAFLAATASLASAITQQVSFQGKLLDSSNNPRNGALDFTFAIYDVPSGGTALWTESQTGVTVNNGVFSVALGSVNPLPLGLFTNASAYLEVQVAPDSPMTPRQQLLVSPFAFHAMLADDLAPGNTSYIQASVALQAGAVFHVSSATVEGPLLVTRTSTFTATGSQTYSLSTSSGLYVQSGTLRVDGTGGVTASGVWASTIAASSSLLLPQGSGVTTEGSARWDPAVNELFIGTGTATKTMVDTDSSQTLTGKTLASGSNVMIDATHLQGRPMDSASPSDGMSLRWDATGGKWTPAYVINVSVVTTPFTPAANITLTADTIFLAPLIVPGRLQLNQIRYRVTTRAAGVTGDVGLYDDSGNLVASGGANSADFTSTGAQVVTVQNAPVTVLPGQYYLAMSAPGAPSVRGANLSSGAAGVVKGLGSITETTGAGSTLPSSISLGSIVDGFNAVFMSLNQ